MSLIDLPADDACTLYLLRHGATPPNLVTPPVIQGAAINEPLAPIGREQAACVAGALAGRPLKAVYSSPLHRARETAEIVAEPHGLPVTTIAGLKEVEVGEWVGRDWEDIRKNEPEAYAAFHEGPGVPGYPGGETLLGLLERVTASLTELMQQHIGEEIAVTAHSVVNRVYTGSVLGLSLANGYWIPQANCCINLIRYRDGEAKLVTFNAVGHLM